MMASKACMNVSCGATLAIDWRKGWALRSGGFANLCDTCGSAYEQLIFCDMFHSKESGWRECNTCGKRLHCGCIASKSSVELLDSGGVECISCMKHSELSSVPSEVNQSMLKSPHKVMGLPAKNINECVTTSVVNACELQSTSAENKMEDDAVDKGKRMQLGKNIDGNGQSSILLAPEDDVNESLGRIKREQVVLPVGEVGGTSFSNINHTSVGSSQLVIGNDRKETKMDKEIYESLAHACLGITLGTSNRGTTAEACYNTASGTPNFTLPIPSVVAEGREQSKALSAFQQVQRSRHLLPKPPKTSPSRGSETSKDTLPQVRVARPPGEGRGRSQLLPRYWPRITDQELQQISGDSNATIVPLFEKVLSASDAGRIGRLVLPKACAEAYFPPISQPEGLPLKIQDAKGKDWVFQFRFWPNNNSRMYVLEGVTPCIQSMQLQAGDTVTFSRMDPEGKLVMGFRKATNSGHMQDTQISSFSNGAPATETFFSGVIENLPIISSYSGLLQSLKGSTDPHLNPLPEHLFSSAGNIRRHPAEKHGTGTNEVPPLLGPEKKRSRNIGSKSKRLHMDNEDALELKLTWEEAQDLLRPPPSVKPSVVMVEDHEFEEYEDPPIFGKKTVFTVGPSGGKDQWAQCDNCYRWRRLPVDVLIPSKWTCAENLWDPRRRACSAPDETNSKELENLLRLSMDSKKRKLSGSFKQALEHELSGLDALATAAVFGEDGNSTMPSIATTTKHPRHRPGCTCIVCIQPPSGKGPKHKPTCTCNVCLTVKRRFKTLMMRKKKRQSEREAETAQKKHVWAKDEVEVDSALRSLLPVESVEKCMARVANELEADKIKFLLERGEAGKGQIDLNCQPERDEELQAGSSRASMMSLLQVASLPLETYLKQNGLTSLICEQQTSSGSHLLPQATTGETSEGRPPDESYFATSSMVREREVGGEEGCCVPDQSQNDPPVL